MYYFLAMLETTDFRTMQTTIPIVLCVLWMNHRTISHGACFLQAYFIHSLPITESEILFAVSCDWFIAICHPLQCTSILNNTQVIKIGSGVFMRGFIFICPNIASLLVFLLQIPCSLSPILPISGCYQTSHVLTLPSVTCILLWQYFL